MKKYYIREGRYEGDVWGDDPFYSVVSDSPEGLKDYKVMVELSEVQDLLSVLGMCDEVFRDNFNVPDPGNIHARDTLGIRGHIKRVLNKFKNSTKLQEYICLKIFEADWEMYGNRAGPIRNNKMTVYSDALLLIWDGESRGSAHMKSAMLKLKKPIYEVVFKKP